MTYSPPLLFYFMEKYYIIISGNVNLFLHPLRRLYSDGRGSVFSRADTGNIFQRQNGDFAVTGCARLGGVSDRLHHLIDLKFVRVNLYFHLVFKAVAVMAESPGFADRHPADTGLLQNGTDLRKLFPADNGFYFLHKLLPWMKLPI